MKPLSPVLALALVEDNSAALVNLLMDFQQLHRGLAVSELDPASPLYELSLFVAKPIIQARCMQDFTELLEILARCVFAPS